MRESEKRQVYETAIERLVDELVAKTQPDNPVPYARRIRQDLSARHYQHARDLFAEHGELTADELHTLLYALDHPAVTTKPAVRYHNDLTECRTCGARGGGGWIDGDRDEHGLATDLVPCPTCAPDRHRRHQAQTTVELEDRDDWRKRYTQAIRDTRTLLEAER